MGSKHRTLREISDVEEAGFDGAEKKNGKKHKKTLGDRTLDDILGIYKDVQDAASTVQKRIEVSGVDNCTQPDGDELELEWVHGFSCGFDNRNSIHYVTEPFLAPSDAAKIENPERLERLSLKNVDNGSGRFQGQSRYIVYAAAGLGIVLEINDRKSIVSQRYFRGHTDDITALAVRVIGNGGRYPHSVKETQERLNNGCREQGLKDLENTQYTTLVATGQMGKGETYVWTVPSMKTMAIIKTGQKTVSHLEFSKADNGRVLVSMSPDTSCCICDWKSQTVLARLKSNSNRDIYHLSTNSLIDDKFSFVSVGNKSVNLWSLKGRNLSSQKVRLGRGNGSLKFLCAAEVNGVTCIGAENGYLYALNPKDMKSLNKGIKSCEKMPKNNHILCMKSDDYLRLLVVGMRDGQISFFDTSRFNANADSTSTSEPSLDLIRTITIDGVFSDVIAKQVCSRDTLRGYVARSLLCLGLWL